MPRSWVSERAPRTASGEQQALVPSVSGSAQSLTVTATTSAPRSRSLKAATALSTPPETATRTLPSTGGAIDSVELAIAESARWRASAVSIAAWRRAGLRPPSSASICEVPIRAAASTVSPSTISQTQAQAARVAAQPSVAKTADSIRPPLVVNEIRARSPQAAPPAAPVKAPGGGSASRERSATYSASRDST